MNRASLLEKLLRVTLALACLHVVDFLVCGYLGENAWSLQGVINGLQNHRLEARLALRRQRPS